MKIPEKFEFDPEDGNGSRLMTITEIRWVCSAYSDHRVRQLVRAGLNTKSKIMNYRPDLSAIGRRGRAGFERVNGGPLQYGSNV